MFSQNQEEKYTLEYFKNFKGRFLDIGAADGVGLSNTRALAELGWSGVCVEPCTKVFNNLQNNYKNENKVFLIQCAIGVMNGEAELFANDTYYSTLEPAEMNRWQPDPSIKFEKELVLVYNFNTFLTKIPHNKFDFISIDCEGLDYEILRQMNLDELECKMICIETNGIETQKYIDYIEKFGMKLIYQSPENILMAK